MIDADGIERPDDTSAHVLTMPQKGELKKIKKKSQLLRTNIFSRIGCYLVRILATVVLSVVYFFAYRLKTEGRKNKRAMKKRAVVVSNHCHVIDVTLFTIRFMPRLLYITSIPENFRIPVIGGFIKLAGAIPIPHDLGGMRLFNEVINELLQKDKAVAFMPEGSMWHKYRDLRPFKRGAFIFAAKNNAPVLPAVTTMKIIHKTPTKKRYRLKLSYLPAIYPDESLPPPQAAQKLLDEVYAAMKAKIEEEKGHDVFTRKYRRQLEKQGLAASND